MHIANRALVALPTAKVMIYQVYQTYADLLEPLRWNAHSAAPLLNWSYRDPRSAVTLRAWAAACEIFGDMRLTDARPPFGISRVQSHDEEFEVEEKVEYSTAFGSLLHFVKKPERTQPAVLLVAPMSGHFATLLRGTVQTLLADHDVYITDWHNARDVPADAGQFDLSDYIAHLMLFLKVIGPGAHMIAVCQPTVPALAAAALLAEDKSDVQPRTLTLMAGPIDTRVNPTEVNRLAQEKPLKWFATNLIGTVPLRYRGAFRRVYPGFVQISAFMSMNPDRHANAMADLFNYLVEGDLEKARTIKVFYDEYFATADLPAEFYLETVGRVFQDHALPLGELTFHGRPIHLSAIRRTALFTVEGEKDDICAIGQTLAAQELCIGVPPFMRKHHIQTGAGHYGVFNGRRWQTGIYPMLREFIHTFN
ncbi:MAG: polyhydroxyalkanoate depolymerase [Burkholderiaceae bacterium]|jgi:polyhydroxyalkanoate depolymerase